MLLTPSLKLQKTSKQIKSLILERKLTLLVINHQPLIFHPQDMSEQDGTFSLGMFGARLRASTSNKSLSWKSQHLKAADKANKPLTKRKLSTWKKRFVYQDINVVPAKEQLKIQVFLFILSLTFSTSKRWALEFFIKAWFSLNPYKSFLSHSGLFCPLLGLF